MLLRYIFLLLYLFIYIVDATEYPQTFAKMGTPLFKSNKAINNFSNIESLQKSSHEYIKCSNIAIQNGFIVDKSNSDSEKKNYLLELRKLQKKYDKFLYQLHRKIDLAIKDKDYDTFYRLISYEFDGLLKNKGLLKKSLAFYNIRKSKKKNKFLDSKIQYKKLLIATQSEFHVKVTKSTYSSSSKETSKKSVYIFSKLFDDYIAIFARNKNPFSITINIKGKTENLIYRGVKKTFSMKANSTVEHVKLYKKHGSYSYMFGYSWIKGSMDAVHDNSYLYRLPYARGTSHIVSQGFNGKATHKGRSAYAVDFAMKIGTKIYAARDGIVVGIKDDSTKVGFSQEFAKDGNFISIEHKDATFATYYHLKKNGVRVRVGQSVKRGDYIGNSGNTGYSSGPHLHFQVYKAVDAKSTQSIPIKFISYNGIVRNPKRGIYYKAK